MMEYLVLGHSFLTDWSDYSRAEISTITRVGGDT